MHGRDARRNVVGLVADWVLPAAVVVRWTLLEEGGNAVAVVVGAEQLGECGAHPSAQVAPVGVERSTQAPLECLFGQRRVAGDIGSEGQRCRQQVVVRHHTPHEADVAGVIGVDHPAGEQRLGCAVAPDERGSRASPATWQHRPRFTNRSPNFARSEAIRMSAMSASSMTQPTAAPLTAAVIGTSVRNRLQAAGVRRGSRSPRRRSALAATITCLTSSPEQDTGSRPVITRHRAVVVSTASASSA